MNKRDMEWLDRPIAVPCTVCQRPRTEEQGGEAGGVNLWRQFAADEDAEVSWHMFFCSPECQHEFRFALTQFLIQRFRLEPEIDEDAALDPRKVAAIQKALRERDTPPKQT